MVFHQSIQRVLDLGNAFISLWECEALRIAATATNAPSTAVETFTKALASLRTTIPDAIVARFEKGAAAEELEEDMIAFFEDSMQPV